MYQTRSKNGNLSPEKSEKLHFVAKSCGVLQILEKLQKVAKRMQIYLKVAFLHPCNKPMALLITGFLYSSVITHSPYYDATNQ